MLEKKTAGDIALEEQIEQVEKRVAAVMEHLDRKHIVIMNSVERMRTEVGTIGHELQAAKKELHITRPKSRAGRLYIAVGAFMSRIFG